MHITTLGGLPITIGWVIALVVLIIAILGIVGVVPFGLQTVFSLIAALAVARLL